MGTRANRDKFPAYRGKLEYVCLDCEKHHDISELLYTCPDCGSVLLLEDQNFDSLTSKSPEEWREIFDLRAASKNNALRGIFRFYELLAPVLEEKDIIYLGDGNTPVVEASSTLQAEVGARFAYKNDGQNPSASFKDRGMACAFSFLKALASKNKWDEVLAVCASTGDTSAAAALYASYVGAPLKSVVLLPQGKVTPQQLSQPLGSGAVVLELPGVFDDCMKVVENLAENYRVALLNSKNSWRILGQESYACEVAQWRDWDTENLAVFVPVGNAGNVTAIMNGFMKMLRLGIITHLPHLFGVQSSHADPVYRYYSAPKDDRSYKPVEVRPSAAQAAMIGNPVSFPRVKKLVERYEALGGDFSVVQVEEQQIMDSMLQANSHGHIACTQGGECLAGLKNALSLGLIGKEDYAILDSTAHALKFADFQNMYFNDSFPIEYEIKSKPERVNKPELIMQPEQKKAFDTQGSKGQTEFTRTAAVNIAKRLGLKQK